MSAAMGDGRLSRPVSAHFQRFLDTASASHSWRQSVLEFLVPRYTDPELEAAYLAHRNELKRGRGKRWLPCLALLGLLYMAQLGSRADAVSWTGRVFMVPVLLLFLAYWLWLLYVPKAGYHFDRVIFGIFMYIAVGISFTPDRIAGLLDLEGNSWRPTFHMEAKCTSRMSGMFMVSALLAELPPGHFLVLMHFCIAVFFCSVLFLGSMEYDVMSRAQAEGLSQVWTHGALAFEVYCIGMLAFAATHRRELRDRENFESWFRATAQVQAHEKRESDMQRENQQRVLVARLEDALWDGDETRAQLVRHELTRGNWSDDASPEATTRILRAQSEAAGVSVAYLLSDEFLDLARTCTDEDNPSFYSLKTGLFFGSHPIGASTLCPRDGRPGCALVDTLPKHYRRASTHFLSWTWGYTVMQVRGALKEWLDRTGIDAQQTFLFMCFFTNNQYRILVEGCASGSTNLEAVFETNLLRIGRMVALLDHWDNPTYLKRIWTIFEQFTAVKIGIKVDMIFPPSSREALIEQIYRGEDGIRRVKGCLCNVHSEEAEATMPEDELKIKSLIRCTIGFQAVDGKVRHFLVEWVSREVGGLMHDLISKETGTLKNALIDVESWHMPPAGFSAADQAALHTLPGKCSTEDSAEATEKP